MRHDLLISYARHDDQPFQVGQPGWITAFLDALRRLHRRFLPRDLGVFMDYADIPPFPGSSAPNIGALFIMSWLVGTAVRPPCLTRRQTPSAKGRLRKRNFP